MNIDTVPTEANSLLYSVAESLYKLPFQMTSTSSNKNQWRSEGAVVSERACNAINRCSILSRGVAEPVDFARRTCNPDNYICVCFFSFQVRRSDEHATMPGPRSLHARTKNLFAKDPQTLDNSNSHKENTNYGEVDIEASAHSQSQKNSHHHATHQYRLECRAPTEASLFRRIITLNGWLRPLGNTTGPSEGINSNQSLAMHLHWMFRVNFCFLFLVMCTIFFVLVIFFAGFIALAGRMDAQCVRVGSLSFGESGAPFADAFALSWTTMATVSFRDRHFALLHILLLVSISGSLNRVSFVFRLGTASLIQLLLTKIQTEQTASLSILFVRWKR